MRVWAADFAHGDHGRLIQPVVLAVTGKDGPGHGQGHDAVVRDMAAVRDEFEGLAFAVVPFEPRPHDIADNRSQHTASHACIRQAPLGAVYTGA